MEFAVHANLEVTTRTKSGQVVFAIVPFIPLSVDVTASGRCCSRLLEFVRASNATSDEQG